MQITNLTLAYAILEYKPLLENNIVAKVQELENGWLKIRLRSGQAKDLILAHEIFFFSSYSMNAKQVSSGFGGFLKKHLAGKKILKLEQHSLDRIAVFEFHDYFLILELFAKGNIVLTDKAMKILGVLRNEQWKDRTLRKGSDYKFPASKGLNPKEITVQEFVSFVGKGDLDIVHALIKALNIAPIFAEEALADCEIPKNTPFQSLPKKQLEKILARIKEFYSPKKPLLKPVLAESGSLKLILPFELKSAKTIEGFGALSSAFEGCFAKRFFSSEQVGAQKACDKKIAELEKSIELQKSAKEKFENQIALNRKKAEAVYAHYNEIENAFSLLLELKSGKGNKKDVMYKLNSLPFVKSFDLKKNRLTVEFG